MQGRYLVAWNIFPNPTTSPESPSAPMLQALVAAAERGKCWEQSLDLLWWIQASGESKLHDL